MDNFESWLKTNLQENRESIPAAQTIATKVQQRLYRRQMLRRIGGVAIILLVLLISARFLDHSMNVPNEAQPFAVVIGDEDSLDVLLGLPQVDSVDVEFFSQEAIDYLLVEDGPQVLEELLPEQTLEELVQYLHDLKEENL